MDEQVATGDWATPSEFVRELIRRDKESKLASKAAKQEKRRRTRRLSRQVQSGMAVMEELMAQKRAEGKKE